MVLTGRHWNHTYAASGLPAMGVSIHGDSDTDGANLNHQFAINGCIGREEPLQHSTWLCSSNFSQDAS